MDKLKRIVLNNFDVKGNVIHYDFNKFKEIESCTLNRFEINDDIIDKLNEMKNLKTIVFCHCIFKSERKLVSNVENLMIIYCKNVQYSNFLNASKVRNLMFTNVENIDVKDIKVFENIEELSIFECEIKNFSAIDDLKKLKDLKLDGSKIDDEEKIQELKGRLNIQYKKTYHVGF